MGDMDRYDNGADQVGRMIIFLALAVWMASLGGWFDALAAFFVIMAGPSVAALIGKRKRNTPREG
jgi:dipeptide/tripeptide permease